MVWGRRELAAPLLHSHMARHLRPLVDNNRLKKKERKKANLQTMTKKKIKKTRAVQFAVKAKRTQALGFRKSWALNGRKDALFLGHHLPLKPRERQESSHFKVCDIFCHELALVRSEVALLLYPLVVQTHYKVSVSVPTAQWVHMEDAWHTEGCIHVLYPILKFPLALWALLGSSPHIASLQLP